jgi:hypothetical protein
VAFEACIVVADAEVLTLAQATGGMGCVLLAILSYACIVFHVELALFKKVKRCSRGFFLADRDCTPSAFSPGIRSP